MRLDRFRLFLAAPLALGFFVIGCGGGGGEAAGGAGATPPPGQAAYMAWQPPRTFADNSALDPARDLDYYEFYVRGDQNFSDDDAPVAQVAAVMNVLSPDGQTVTPQLISEFLLDNLRPFTEPGQVHYVSIRAVGVDQSKSDFSAPVVWDLENT